MTRDKERKNCILSISRETYPSGERYIQGIIHDITNLKRIERATFQIEKLRSTATLLRTLAHEVRNPLTNINLSVEQLKPEIEQRRCQHLSRHHCPQLRSYRWPHFRTARSFTAGRNFACSAPASRISSTRPWLPPPTASPSKISGLILNFPDHASLCHGRP